MTKMKMKFMRKPVILAVAVLVLASATGIFCTVAYAQATRTSVTGARPDTFFDPFSLTRVILSGNDLGEGVVLATNPNNNGNGWGPPISVPARPAYRSAWCPPFGHAWGRNGIE